MAKLCLKNDTDVMNMETTTVSEKSGEGNEKKEI